jgi:hypothetical protein
MHSVADRTPNLRAARGREQYAGPDPDSNPGSKAKEIAERMIFPGVHCAGGVIHYAPGLIRNVRSTIRRSLDLFSCLVHDVNSRLQERFQQAIPFHLHCDPILSI